MMSYDYGPYRQERSARVKLSPMQKALLLGVGGLLAHRGLVGVKRALIMSKVNKGALRALPSREKLKILKDMKLARPYERWAKKKVSA